jgi:glycosyltransferase involved in cell wall biosynthesis
MKMISIVIPVYNEEKFIDGILTSIEKVNYPRDQYETIVVSDGSTDRTCDVVRKHPDVRLIELPRNMGRYRSREMGAREARFPHILFVDSRTVVDPDILNALDQTQAKVVNGYVMEIDRPGSFAIFYRAIRRVVFRPFYQKYNQPLLLTPQNFDIYPKGTTVFFVDKDVLFQAYQVLANEDMGIYASDDTKLLRTIVNLEPILIHPGVKITYIPRPSFRASLRHLFDRGVRFVDYYLSFTKQKFWLVIFLPLLAMLGILLGLIFVPLTMLIKAAVLIGLDLVLTTILARSLREFLIILYIMPVCVFIFYLGILRGIYLKFTAALRK